jgi:hypothetical protein
MFFFEKRTKKLLQITRCAEAKRVSLVQRATLPPAAKRITWLISESTFFSKADSEHIPALGAEMRLYCVSVEVPRP